MVAKVGLIVRSELDRGLGALSRLIHDMIKPDSTLGLNIDVADHHYTQDWDQYPGATVVNWSKGVLSEEAFKKWIRNLDIVISLETFYDRRIPEWCAEAGVKTALYVMPEMLPHDRAKYPEPDVLWYPTRWRTSPGDTILPVPLPRREFVAIPDHGERVKLIHVGGKQALGDRNGTEALVNVAPRLMGNGQLTIYSQTYSTRVRSSTSLPTTLMKGPDDKWLMYENAHALVMPRRYGGLCLPILEALSCGLAVVMTAVEPNHDWPILPILTVPGRVHEMPCGTVETVDPDSMQLAHNIALATHPQVIQELMHQSREFALQNTPEALCGRWSDAIDHATRS